MTELKDTPNTPGTYGYDDRKPATISGSSPAKPLPAATPGQPASGNNDPDGQHRTGSDDNDADNANRTTGYRHGGVPVDPVDQPSLATDPAVTPSTMPHEGDPKSGFEKVREAVGIHPQPYVADAAVGGTRGTRPSWATGHAAFDIHNNATDRRLVLTIDGQNYSGLVAAPGGNKEIAKMLRDMADKVEIGQA